MKLQKTLTSKWKRVFVWIGLILVLPTCAHKKDRRPAEAPPVLTDEEAQAMADLMGMDSPHNSYRHPLKLEIHVDGDKRYLKNQAQKALQEALVNTLMSDTPEQGLAKVFTSNLKESLMDNFVKTLLLYKIINMGIQVDFSFLPESYSASDYAPELASNNLVRLSDVGGLSRKFQVFQTPVTNHLYSQSFSIPEGEPVSYIGGVLSLYIKILDAQVRPKLPNTQSNAVKGFLRYRRFYRLNQKPEPLLQSSCGEGIALAYRQANSAEPLFYTVDLYKGFNLKNIDPVEETWEVYPALIASHKEGRRELMSKRPESSGSSIAVGGFYLEKKSSSRLLTEAQVKKLVFDLKKDKDLNLGQSLIEGNKLTSSEIQSYFRKCQKDWVQYFKLNEIVGGGLL